MIDPMAGRPGEQHLMKNSELKRRDRSQHGGVPMRLAVLAICVTVVSLANLFNGNARPGIGAVPRGSL